MRVVLPMLPKPSASCSQRLQSTFAFAGRATVAWLALHANRQAHTLHYDDEPPHPLVAHTPCCKLHCCSSSSSRHYPACLSSGAGTAHMPIDRVLSCFIKHRQAPCNQRLPNITNAKAVWLIQKLRHTAVATRSRGATPRPVRARGAQVTPCTAAD